MSALRILRMMQRALPAAAPGVTNVAALLVAHDLGGPRRGRQRGCLGGCRAACRQQDPALGPHGTWLVVLDANDAARLASVARMLWMLAVRTSATIRDYPVARPHWYGRFDSRGTDRRDPLLLGSRDDRGNDMLTARSGLQNSLPLPGAPKMS